MCDITYFRILDTCTLLKHLSADCNSGYQKKLIRTCNPNDPENRELARAKPQENGAEARSRCDVLIHGISWV